MATKSLCQYNRYSLSLSSKFSSPITAFILIRCDHLFHLLRIITTDLVPHSNEEERVTIHVEVELGYRSSQVQPVFNQSNHSNRLFHMIRHSDAGRPYVVRFHRRSVCSNLHLSLQLGEQNHDDTHNKAIYCIHTIIHYIYTIHQRVSYH